MENAANSNAALQILIKISDHLSSNYGEDLNEPIKKLSDHFKKESESAVRVKVVIILVEIQANYVVFIDYQFFFFK